MKITHKNALITLCVGLVMIFLLSMIWPRLFYTIAKNELTTYISGSIRECSVRLSYLLSSHSNSIDLRDNETVLSLLHSYHSETLTQEEVQTELMPYLHVYAKGKTLNGSIEITNYSLLATEQGECFYSDTEQDLAAAFMKTDVLQNIHRDTDGSFYSDQYYVDADGKFYTPVIYLDMDGESTGYFCFVGSFVLDGISHYAISLMPFDDVYRQLEPLMEIGVHDFSLVCKGRTLFQNLPDSELSSSVSTDSFSEKQYDVTTSEYRDGILFHVLCSYPLENFYLTVNMSRAELIAPYKDFFYLLEIILCLLILLMVFISTIIFHLSMDRLKKLDTEMKRVRSGDFNIVLKDDGADEIGSIARTINMMITTIKTSLEKQIVSAKLEKEMQYSLLVSAIDPHFIYNTLDTITFLAAMKKCDDIILVNNALIGTLKDRIKMKNLKIYDSVRNEKHVIEQYMIIESYLYSNPIDFQFLADEADYDLMIPKNIIQPLVENAIKHGLMPNKTQNRAQTKAGQIIVCVENEEDSILLSVTDNGVGMDEEKRKYYLSDIDEPNMDPEHIGLLNMRLRLSYLYQENFDFQIECPDSGGTSVLIRLRKSVL